MTDNYEIQDLETAGMIALTEQSVLDDENMRFVAKGHVHNLA